MELSAVLRLDSSQYDRQAKKAEKDGKGLAGRMTKMAGTVSVAMGNLLAHGVEATARAVKDTVLKSLNAAGELEQQLGGLEAVFGEVRHNMMDFAKDSWKNLGLSEAKYLSFANKMGSLLQGSGLDQKKAGELTVEVMQRAADVASIMGISVEDAMTAVAGAAKGNFTMMDNLGVAINDTALSAYALEKGLGKTTKQMTTAEKVTLAYEMFLEKTAYAAGNYNRENDTFAGSLNTLNAAWENLLAGVGDGTELVDALVGKNGNGGALGAIFKTAEKVLPKLWDGLTKGVKAAWPKVTKFLGQKLDKLPTALGPMLSSGVNGLLGIVNSLFGTDFQPIDIKLPSFSEITKKVKDWWTTGSIGDKIRGACTWMLGLFQNVDGTPTDATTKIKEWWDGLGVQVANVGTWLISQATGVDADDTQLRKIIMKWWSTSGTAIGKLTTWAISLPTGVMSANEAGKSLHDIINEWWTGHVENLQDLLRWTFGIPDPSDPNGTATKAAVETWWNTRVKPTLEVSAQFMIGLLGYDNIDDLGEDWARRLAVAGLKMAKMFGIDKLFGFDADAKIEEINGNYQRRKETGFQNKETEYWSTRTAAQRLAESTEFQNAVEQAARAYGLTGEPLANTVKGAMKLVEGMNQQDALSYLRSNGILDLIGDENLKRFGFEDYGGSEKYASAVSAFDRMAHLLTGSENSDVVQAMEERFGEDQGSEAFKNYMAMFRQYLETGKLPENVEEVMDDVQLDFQTVFEEMDDAGDGTAATFKALAEAATYAASVLESLSVPTGGEQSNAKGLDYVPYSGYLTELHKGEAILSGNEAREWRESGGRGQDYNTTGALLGAIQGLGNKLAGMQMYVGEKAFGGVVVDYGGRGMNRYIGGMQQRKRRGLGRR